MNGLNKLFPYESDEVRGADIAIGLIWLFGVLWGFGCLNTFRLEISALPMMDPLLHPREDLLQTLGVMWTLWLVGGFLLIVRLWDLVKVAEGDKNWIVLTVHGGQLMRALPGWHRRSQIMAVRQRMVAEFLYEDPVTGTMSLFVEVNFKPARHNLVGACRLYETFVHMGRRLTPETREQLLKLCGFYTEADLPFTLLRRPPL